MSNTHAPSLPPALAQARDQIAPRDLDLLLDRVARDADDLHAIAERGGDVEQVVRRADEETRRQVEGQVEVVIDERVVLRGVEYFEHCGRRVTGGTAAGHLVDLVDHEHEILDLYAAERLQNEYGHRPDVRAPVSADLRFVADAAHRDAV